MIEDLPVYIPWVFGLTTVAMLLLFYRVAEKSAVVVLTLVAWLVIQGTLAFGGVYHSDTDAVPPQTQFIQQLYYY